MRKLITVLALASLPVLYGCAAAVIGGAAAGGYLVGEDRRPAAVLTDDQAIEFRISNRISEKKFPGAHVNSTSYNRMVLLTGEVPTEEAKADVERIAREVPNVRGIYNELHVGPATALSSRTNDSYLTSLVKTRFVDVQKFNPVHVKVVTENSTVYLMGIVKRSEGDGATEIARMTRGVRRVVRAFEYQD